MTLCCCNSEVDRKEDRDMIIQKDYLADNIIKTTYIDGVDKVDTGVYDNGISFCNIYRKGRKKEDDFETITADGINIYILNSEGKTLRALRSKGR